MCIFALLLMNPGCRVFQEDRNIIHTATSLPSTTPWDLIALSQRPDYKWSDQNSPVWSLYYEGQSYKNQPTRVFAYYANPATLKTKNSGTKKFPAVVLAHGGGGTAFKEWAELWARRGYAAIAMDLAGCGPDRVAAFALGRQQKRSRLEQVDLLAKKSIRFFAVGETLFGVPLK